LTDIPYILGNITNLVIDIANPTSTSFGNPIDLVDEVVNDLCPVLESFVPKTNLPPLPFPLSLAQGIVTAALSGVTNALPALINVHHNFYTRKLFMDITNMF
jgi:hypothetical protein